MSRVHLVFDMDGTIMQIPVEWSKVLSELEDLLGYKLSGILPILRKLYGTPLYRSINSVIEKYELKAINKIRVLDDSPRVLVELSKKYPIHLVTMQSRRVAQKALELMGIASIPLTLVTRDEAGFRETQLKLVMNKHNLRPSQVVFIADKVLDMCIAYKLGVRGILVARKDFNPQVSSTDNLIEDLETLGIIIVENLRELLILL